MNILITEMIWPNGIEKLQSLGTVTYNPDLWKDEENLKTEVANSDALIVRNQTQVNQDMLDHAKDLKVIGRLGVGLDNIDVSYAKKQDIPVVYAKNANATSVAEYVFAAMLNASRTLSSANQDVHKGGWNRREFTGSELAGKTLGLIGLGEIAQRVAKRAKAFGLNVSGYDPFVSKYDFPYSELDIEPVSYDQLLSQSDFISVHVPLTNDTKHLISSNQLNNMKENAYIINTSRGGIIQELDLLDAVNKSQIGGACLDVLEDEPITKGHPLLTNEHITITPHIAGLTEESQFRTSELVAEEVTKILQGKKGLCTI